MNLIISYKSRFRIWIIWMFLVIGLFCTFAHSWRISQKCPHGHYYNDGCTACWCDVTSGQTKCEKLLQCARVTNHVKCPRGRRYKDSCGNDCTCYEATGAVFCNEKVKCSQDLPATVHVPKLSTPSSIDSNVLQQRMGIAAPYIPPIETHPIRFHIPGTTPSPQFRSPSSTTTARNRYNGFYENFAIESTPHPHVRIPSSGKSDELIIEPAIIIRKKGSNKASIVRNSNSATSLTLPSSRLRNQDQPLIFSKSDSGKGDSIVYPSSFSKAASLAPLLLYEKQLQTIMNIRRAYSQLLRSKVNVNVQMVTGNAPPSLTSSVTQNQADHPRRFDSNSEHSTILTHTTPSPSVFMTSQQPKPPPNIHVKPFQPLVWRKEIKNVLKQFSPVPPLKQLVSYVSTSTENYLKDFLNNHRLQQPVLMLPAQESSTSNPLPSQEPPFLQTSPKPPLSHIPYPFSTISPFQEHQHDPSIIPIHEVYQNHEFKKFTSTPQPPSQLPFEGHNSYLHKTLNYPTYQQDTKKEHFPFMNELIREIARMDSTTPFPDSSVTPTFSTPGPPYAKTNEVLPLSFLPPPQPEPATPTRRTFTQDGRNPFLNQHQYGKPVHVHPTVRVNLDKPIYINQPHQHSKPNQRYPPLQQQQSQHSVPAQQRFPQPPQQYPHSSSSQQNFPPPHQHSQYPSSQSHRFHPPSQPLPPQQTNRRVYSTPHRPHYIHSPHQLQQHYQHAQPIQRHDKNHQYNTQYRPAFPQYFMPKSKPKQYRLTLKGPVRDAAVRMDNVVPRFVNKIAHEFFKKPEIYIPKIRPGKPLTLEKVVLNHKEIIPTAMSFGPTPGAPPMKLHFTPQAQWEMKEDLARQGIMLDEPLTTPLRDYVANDPNVMTMDAPVSAVQTWETHSDMGMGALQDYPSVIGDRSVVPPTSIPQIIQQAVTNQQLYDPLVFQPLPTPPQTGIHQPEETLEQEQQQVYNPILFPSPTPTQSTLPSLTLDHQHQQELQHQILLAQQQQQATSGSSSHNDFKFDLNDFNEFKNEEQHHIFPQELEIPGVEQVIVDKYIVHDPMDPVGSLRMYTSTTIQPPTNEKKVDLSSLLTQHHRNGLAALPAQAPTLPPAVLVRHHGAPTPSTTPLPPSPTQSPFLTSPYPGENVFVTVINSTPQPFVTTTFAPVGNSPSPARASGVNSGVTVEQASNSQSLVSQIQDFLAEEMDFGARPQLNLYDMLFQHRTGQVEPNNEDENREEGVYNHEHHDLEGQHDDQIAAETKSMESADVDTDKVANIFSMDYKNKYNNRKPPAVIVIKVPRDQSDASLPKVVDDDNIEIIGGRMSKSRPRYEEIIDGNDSEYSMEVATKRSRTSTTTQKSFVTSESSEDDEEDTFLSKEISSSEKRRRNRKNRKRKRRRRKKKNREKSKAEDDESEVRRTEITADNGNRGSSDRVINIDNESDKQKDNRASERNNSEEKYSNNNYSSSMLVETTTSKVDDGKNLEEAAAVAEEKFQAELDWKSQLMANICDLNPSSPLCLTYRSICLLMTSDD